MGHSVGVSNAYYRPREQDILDDYVKAIPLLTINSEYRLRLENERLKLRNKDDENLIRARLQEREEEIDYSRERDALKDEAIANLSDKMMKVMEEIKLLKTKSTDILEIHPVPDL